MPAGKPPTWNRIVLLFWTLTLPVRVKPAAVFEMFQEIELMVTPGAICNAKPIVPVSPSDSPCDDDGGGGAQESMAADARAITRIPLRT